jgi:hypothetical protein
MTEEEFAKRVDAAKYATKLTILLGPVTRREVVFTEFADPPTAPYGFWNFRWYGTFTMVGSENARLSVQIENLWAYARVDDGLSPFTWGASTLDTRGETTNMEHLFTDAALMYARVVEGLLG